MHPSLLRMIIVGNVHLCCHWQSELFVSCRLSIDSLLSREMLENRGEWMFYPDVKEYLRKMRGNIDFAVMKERLPLVHRYWQVTEAEVERIVREESEEDFWTSVQQIILLDAKLVLLRSYISEFDFQGFSEEEIIENIELDHSTYTKELCGYNLTDTGHPSILFGKGR